MAEREDAGVCERTGKRKFDRYFSPALMLASSRCHFYFIYFFCFLNPKHRSPSPHSVSRKRNEIVWPVFLASFYLLQTQSKVSMHLLCVCASLLVSSTFTNAKLASWTSIAIKDIGSRLVTSSTCFIVAIFCGLLEKVENVCAAVIMRKDIVNTHEQWLFIFIHPVTYGLSYRWTGSSWIRVYLRLTQRSPVAALLLTVIYVCVLFDCLDLGRICCERKKKGKKCELVYNLSLLLVDFIHWNWKSIPPKGLMNHRPIVFPSSPHDLFFPSFLLVLYSPLFHFSLCSHVYACVPSATTGLHACN